MSIRLNAAATPMSIRLKANGGTASLRLTQGRTGPTGPAGPAGADGAPGGSDAAFAGWVNDPQSQTRGALADTTARVLPEQHGAKGDGTTDDRAAIQAAITAAQPGQTVWFNAKTYLVGMSGGYGVNLKSGVRLAGPGTLKVKDGVGDYTAMLFADGTTGVTIEDITIDANTAGNPVNATTIIGKRRVVMAVNVTRDLTLRNVTVKNHTGPNTFFLTSTDMERLTVDSCRFLNVGAAPPTEGFDHSTLYLEGIGISITDNYFEAASPLGAHAAIETHGPSAVVSGNIIDGYGMAGNITGVQPWDGDNMVVTSNTARNVMIGWAIYSSTQRGGTTPGVRNLVMAHNTVTIDRDYHLQFADETFLRAPRGFYVDTGADLHIENVDISHNIVHVMPYSSPANTNEDIAAGVTVFRTVTPTTPDKRVRIESNTFVNMPGPGIRYSSSVDQLRIRGNTIINPGGTNSPSTANPFKVGIILSGSTWRDVEVADNLIVDDRTTHLMLQGIDVSSVSSVTNGRIVGNVVRCADGTSLAGIQPATGTGKAFYVEHEQQTWMGLFSPVKVGSRIRVVSDGTVRVNVNATDGSAPTFVQTSAGKLTTQSGLVWAATTPGTVTKKIPVYAANGSTVEGWIALYDTIT